MNNWKLKSLHIYNSSSRIECENVVNYNGTVEFTNGKDEFKLTLNQDQTNEMLKLVSEAVFRSEIELGDKLAKSLKIE